MADRGRRAADRRREREGDSVLGSPVGETTDQLQIDGEWLGTESGLKGGLEGRLEGRLEGGPADDERLVAESDLSQVPTGEHPALSSIAAESERVSARELEETRCAEQPRQRVSEGARLTVLIGKDKGTGQDLIYNEMIIGRSERADLVLRDETVSREHCAIRHAAGHYEVVDLGSEGGTLVNGRPTRRALLKHGDEIECGETILRFLISEGPSPAERPAEPGAEASKTLAGLTEQLPRPRRRPRHRPLAILAFALVVLVLAGALAAGGALYYMNTVGKVRLRLDPVLADLLVKAHEDMKAQRYQDVLVAVQAFLEARPHDVEAQQLRDAAQRQLDQLEIAGQVERAIAQGDLDRARALAAKIQNETPAKKRASEAIRVAQEELRNASLDSVRRLLDEGKCEAAGKLLDSHEQRYPEDEEAGALRAEMVSLLDQRDRHQDQQQRQAIATALQPASRAYARGDSAAAQKLLHDLFNRAGVGAAARRMSRQIETFGRTYARAQVAHRDKQAQHGLALLNEADRLDRTLAPGGSLYRQTIAELTADLTYLIGVQLLGRGDGCAARPHFERARRLNSGDPKHQQQLDRLAADATARLEQAQKMLASDPERARAIAQKASCLVSADSPVGKKLAAFLRRAR
ncbi:MAG: FHA domain-containing protein [Deltaproteobacteria bacterium]|nr:FHA domain-containing protein [Deltaproteobacteria bacterium]